MAVPADGRLWISSLIVEFLRAYSRAWQYTIMVYLLDPVRRLEFEHDLGCVIDHCLK